MSNNTVVLSTLSERLTGLFEDYLAENIGEDILSAYEKGFTVPQVASDLAEAIKQWSEKESNLESLTKLVIDYADEYLYEDFEE